MELLTDKVIYHVETQEDYDDLMRRLEKLECKWEGDRACTSVNFFPYCGENTAIRVVNKETFYSPLSYYLDNINATYKDHQIIKYKKEQNPMKVKLKANEKFIVDWYEANKDDLEHEIGQAYHEIGKIVDKDYQAVPEDIFLYWLGETRENPIRTLINMQQFGYEIEQEPVYYVELPNPNYESKVKKYYLARTADGRIVIQSGNTAELKENWKLTENEIKKDFAWAWDFAKEV